MRKNTAKQKLTSTQQEELMQILQLRFKKNKSRHKGIKWEVVESKLKRKAAKLWSLYEMERTGGEPDMVGLNKKTQEFIFFDCSVQTPKARRSLCYDEDALRSRKEHKPEGSAMQMAEQMGIEMLTEAQYRMLQKLGEFDTTTSSWVQTPAAIRKLGGALFCDRRYDTVFTYHNGAESYYGVRGFRGVLYV